MPSSPLDLSGLPVLVTGGAGFIGSHLVEVLLAEGARVRVLDNFATGHRENLAPFAEGPDGDRLEVIEGDIRDGEACRLACRGQRFVFHQAALGSVPRSLADPVATTAVNVTGTATLFDAARREGVQRVVWASSSSVYGDSDRQPRREGEEGRPLSPYALSKAMDEELADTFHRCYGQELVGLRYFNVYGPRQDPAGPYAAVVPRFFAACLAGRPPEIHGDGGQSRDFTFVRDAVAANLAAAAAGSEALGRAWNVARGDATTVAELAGAIRSLVAERTGMEVPEPVHTERRPGDVRHARADPGEARRVLGFAARVPLEEGLERCFEGYRAKVAPSHR